MPDWLAKDAARKLSQRDRSPSSAAFDRQAALRIVFTDRAEMEDIEDLGESRAGKRKPTINRRRTKVAAKKLP